MHEENSNFIFYLLNYIIHKSQITFNPLNSQINDHLKGLQVQVTHNGHPRKHRVVALKEEPANKHEMTGQFEKLLKYDRYLKYSRQ